MKKLKLFVTALILGGLGLTSCEKEDINVVEPSYKNSESKVQIQKDGGGEEEDPIIIYGLTQNSSNAPIENAEVIILDALTSNPLDTTYSDTQGEFEFEELSGTYYFIASASGYVTLTSGNFDLPDSNPVTLTLQE